MRNVSIYTPEVIHVLEGKPFAYRTPVHGGWILSEATGIAFVPDPAHSWKISVPGMEVSLPLPETVETAI